MSTISQFMNYFRIKISDLNKINMNIKLDLIALFNIFNLIYFLIILYIYIYFFYCNVL